MGKILLIVSFVFVLLSAGLGYMGKTRLSEADAKLATIETDLTKTKSDLAKKNTDLKTATDSIATLTAEGDQLKSQVGTAQTELSAEKSKASDLNTKAAAAEAKAAEMESQLQAKTKEFEDFKIANTVVAPTEQGSAEDKAKVEELTTVNASLQQQTTTLKEQLAGLEKERQDRLNNIVQKGTEGRVLAVNPAWNFVVLSLGDKNGLSSNTELLVKRGRQLVGKVRITSVEPSTSVADIVANSVPKGVTIAPGDQVIYQTTGE